MPNWKKTLPSINLLLIFEAAGRCQSFSKAADELAVSQPAVSHAMRKLEHQLGVKLFERQHRGVELTTAGQQFFYEVTASLDSIYRAAEALMQANNTNHVTLSVSTAFATYWLLPRVAKFKQRYPDIELRCLTTDSDSSLQREIQQNKIDLRIPLGGGEWPEYDWWHFTDEQVAVVCSPAYLNQIGALKGPSDLLKTCMLHLEANYPQRLDWKGWLSQFQVELSGVDQHCEYLFNDYSIVIQAALEGQGVALGWMHIIQPLVDQGRLVQVLPQIVTTDEPFYILAKSDTALSPAASCLKNWLIEEVNSK